MLYALITSIQVYFLHSLEPHHDSIILNVLHKDLTQCRSVENGMMLKFTWKKPRITPKLKYRFYTRTERTLLLSFPLHLGVSTVTVSLIMHYVLGVIFLLKFMLLLMTSSNLKMNWVKL